MLAVLFQVSIPLLSLIILTLGNGLFTTFLALRLHTDAAPTLIIGAVSAVYYAGMVLGSFRAGRIILSAGHVRAYAGFASLTAVITMLHGLFPNPWFWLFLRFWGGYCMAGLFIVIESWVLNRSTSATRGQVLSLYMIAVYAAQAGGQLMVNIGSIESLVPFNIATILATLSVVPLTMVKVELPHFSEPSALTMRALYKISPSGVFGCFIAGLVLGAIYGLLPVYGVQLGLKTRAVTWLMGITILGGMALQFPVGRASDYIQRRTVILLVGGGFILTTLVFMLLKPLWLLSIICLAFFWGGFAFTLYPLSISHTCDYLKPDDIVSATQGLLFAYGIGAAVGPVIAPFFMRELGVRGLMVYFMSTVLVLVIFILWRKTQKPGIPTKEQQAFVTVPSGITPVINELDPRAEPTGTLLAEREENR